VGEAPLRKEKLDALRFWGLIEDDAARIKLTEAGRRLTKSEPDAQRVLRDAVARITPYRSVIERVHHAREASTTADDTCALWHQHFRSEISGSDQLLKEQAICFFQLAHGAALGELILGRRGKPTRFEFKSEALAAFVDEEPLLVAETEEQEPEPSTKDQNATNGRAVAASKPAAAPAAVEPEALGQAIFVAHGKNKKPLDQLKRILDQFKIPFKAAVDEPTWGDRSARRSRRRCMSATAPS